MQYSILVLYKNKLNNISVSASQEGYVDIDWRNLQSMLVRAANEALGLRTKAGKRKEKKV